MYKKPKILFYDIESAPFLAYVWGCGDQYVRHPQLKKGHDQPRVICITYCWNDNKPAQCIDWGYEEQDTKSVIQQFDEIIKQSDFSIGKNSDRFDTKMINAARMLSGLPGLPQWTKYTDDLEKQMRRYFKLPSQSLDYISAQMGLGGKIKMEFQDWIDIVEKNDNGEKALRKMIKYGKKDVTDTRTLWNKLSEHFDSKWNQAAYQGNTLACKRAGCGSLRIYINKTVYAGKTTYYEYNCSDCGRYAGRTNIKQNGMGVKIG